MFQGVCESLYNTFNYGGLISLGSIIGGLFSDIIWPLLWRVLMIPVIGIVIYVSIHIIRYIRDENKKKKAEQKYIDELKVKYGKYSKQELAEIYNVLVTVIDSRKRAREDIKRLEACAGRLNEDQTMSLIVAQTVVAMSISERLPKQYRISVDDEYLHYDIAYLEKRL